MLSMTTDYAQYDHDYAQYDHDYVADRDTSVSRDRETLRTAVMGKALTRTVFGITVSQRCQITN